MAALYPIGIQNFEKIRKEGYLYVDKTALIYQMVKTGSYYFLSRPRRFGKSLLVSTLEAYFQGKEELFEGLAMEKLEQDWLEYPILHLDLNAERYSEASSLDSILQDEYRSILKPFYGVLKTMDGDIRFALLTGVTKFGKVSVFSDLNNLMDISMDDRYVEICGMTETEIHAYMEQGVLDLTRNLQMDYEEVCMELKRRYDGYHFTHRSQGMYNPFSLLNTFAKSDFGDYWFETGTPSYLVELLKHTDYDLYNMAHTETNADVLNSIDAVSRNPIPVIYQSGYLTIKSYNPRFKIYTLGFPNQEVEEGFLNYLLPYYTSVNVIDTSFQLFKFIKEIESGDVDAFLSRLQSFFADTPYELIRNLEVHYQNVLFIVFKLVGFYVKVEYRTSRGRIDLVLQTDHYIYIMEFKLDGTTEEAMRQIEEKQYALPFASDERKLFKIGVNFDNETRNIAGWSVD